jgi:hypothetical protein
MVLDGELVAVSHDAAYATALAAEPAARK